MRVTATGTGCPIPDPDRAGPPLEKPRELRNANLVLAGLGEHDEMTGQIAAVYAGNVKRVQRF